MKIKKEMYNEFMAQLQDFLKHNEIAVDLDAKTKKENKDIAANIFLYFKNNVELNTEGVSDIGLEGSLLIGTKLAYNMSGKTSKWI